MIDADSTNGEHREGSRSAYDVQIDEYCRQIEYALGHLTDDNRTEIESALAELREVIPPPGPATVHLLPGECSHLYERTKELLTEGGRSDIAETMTLPKHPLLKGVFVDENTIVIVDVEKPQEVIAFVTKMRK